MLLVTGRDRRLFGNRAFVKLGVGRSASVFGDAFFNLAVLWVIWSETQSTLQTAIIQAVWHIPDILFEPLAGVFSRPLGPQGGHGHNRPRGGGGGRSGGRGYLEYVRRRGKLHTCIGARGPGEWEYSGRARLTRVPRDSHSPGFRRCIQVDRFSEALVECEDFRNSVTACS